MKANSKQRSRTGKTIASGVNAKQRRALARLGLATVSAYAAPTLLALRSSPHNREASGRVEFAA